MPNDMHLPKVEKAWSVGTILTAILTFATLVTVIGNIWWNTFTIAANAKDVPEIKVKQEQDRSDIKLLKAQQLETNAQYSNIMSSLSKLNDKMDTLSRREARNEGRLSRNSQN